MPFQVEMTSECAATPGNCNSAKAARFHQSRNSPGHLKTPSLVRRLVLATSVATLVTFILATRFLAVCPGSLGTCTPSGMSILPGEAFENDEPCEETDKAGDAERADDADDCRECDRPLEGGSRVPSFAVIEFKKSALEVSVPLRSCACDSRGPSCTDPPTRSSWTT